MLGSLPLLLLSCVPWASELEPVGASVSPPEQRAEVPCMLLPTMITGQTPPSQRAVVLPSSGNERPGPRRKGNPRDPLKRNQQNEESKFTDCAPGDQELMIRAQLMSSRLCSLPWQVLWQPSRPGGWLPTPAPSTSNFSAAS